MIPDSETDALRRRSIRHLWSAAGIAIATLVAAPILFLFFVWSHSFQRRGDWVWYLIGAAFVLSAAYFFASGLAAVRMRASRPAFLWLAGLTFVLAAAAAFGGTLIALQPVFARF